MCVHASVARSPGHLGFLVRVGSACEYSLYSGAVGAYEGGVDEECESGNAVESVSASEWEKGSCADGELRGEGECEVVRGVGGTWELRGVWGWAGIR